MTTPKDQPDRDVGSVDRQRQMVLLLHRFEAAWLAGERPDAAAWTHGLEPVDQPRALDELRALESELRTMSTTDRVTRSPRTEIAGGSPGRFQILGPLSQGGMGVVSIALDTEFHRRVALKEICESGVDDAAYRERFLAEAEITGRLEHPGIVPVYSQGCREDGRPYYAMRLIQGERTGTLQRAIHEFHDSPPTDPVGRDLAFRDLLRRLIDVCNTIEYAHSQNVIHRDLKPANILIGPYGETLVVDWGLASLGSGCGSGSSSTEPSIAGETAAGPVRDDDHRPTRAGHGLGTPGFAAPEQWQGVLEAIGPRSDIYSLGSVLYSLITGTSAFPGAREVGSGTLSQKVSMGDFPRPRLVRADVPLALEAICLKAMRTRAADRYPSARALADDLERFLAGEPVSVHAEPWPLRVQRWARRHRTAVVAASIMLVMTTLSLIGLSLLQARARDSLADANASLRQALEVAERERLRAQDQQALAVSERQRAEDRESLAIRAIQKFRDVIAEDPTLKNSPDLFKLRSLLLGEARGFFEMIRDQFQASGAANPESLAQAGSATNDLAIIHEELGSPDDGARLHREAIAFLEKAIAGSPDADAETLVRWTGELVNSRLGLVYQLLRSGSGTTDQVAAELDRILAAQAISDEHPDQRSLAGDIAVAHTYMATHLIQRRQAGRALTHLSAAQGIRKRLAQAEPEHRIHRRQLADIHSNFGAALDQLGRIEPAIEHARQANQLLVQLNSEAADDVMVKPALATSHHNLAYQLTHAGQPAEAAVELERSLALRREILRDFPSNLENLLAMSHDLHQQLNRALAARRLKDAVMLASESVVVAENLLATNPRQRPRRLELLEAQHRLGHVLDAAGDRSGAPVAYRKSLETVESLLEAEPGSGALIRQQVDLLEHLGRSEQQSGHADRALEWYRRSLPGRTQLAEAPDGTSKDREAYQQLLLVIARLTDHPAAPEGSKPAETRP